MVIVDTDTPFMERVLAPRFNDMAERIVRPRKMWGGGHPLEVDGPYRLIRVIPGERSKRRDRKPYGHQRLMKDRPFLQLSR